MYDHYCYYGYVSFNELKKILADNTFMTEEQLNTEEIKESLTKVASFESDGTPIYKIYKNISDIKEDPNDIILYVGATDHLNTIIEDNSIVYSSHIRIIQRDTLQYFLENPYPDMDGYNFYERENMHKITNFDTSYTAPNIDDIRNRMNKDFWALMRGKKS